MFSLLLLLLFCLLLLLLLLLRRLLRRLLLLLYLIGGLTHLHLTRKWMRWLSHCVNPIREGLRLLLLDWLVVLLSRLGLCWSVGRERVCAENVTELLCSLAYS